MLSVSILTIGDEILIGQIINTNASWIAQKCLEVGATVVEHRVVGDSQNEIIDGVDDLLKKSDVVLITGGLGPTSDDLTKPTLAKYFQDTLIFNEEVLEWIKEFYKKRGINEVSERNRNLANLPSKCKPLKNEFGTAPGMLFEHNGKILVSMPGVPKEMKFIMETHILPLLKSKIVSEKKEAHIFVTLQTCGIPESVLADKLSGVESVLNGLNLAFLPSYKGVRLRIEAKGLPIDLAEHQIEQVKSFIYSKVGDYVYGEGEVTLAETVGKMLEERGETVAVAESCTGGLLGGEFTKISGSSKYFLGGIIAYSNEIKSVHLGISTETLSKYGAVSQETAIEMAYNVRKKFNSTYGISITGIAGPTGGTPKKPVGTVWIGLSTPNETFAKLHQFGGDREINRERSVASALTMLFFLLKGLEL
ncbi:competence/damage-inducible protein A [Bacteroidetes/Chlorobi group bacterium Naka2016]|jgi:nicotinamide-nucleotide amidase|nr:MAG: competence/damage-inducible protein A [Bacteroidetes/Chlorobi group bacterium Naka2016]